MTIQLDLRNLTDEMVEEAIAAGRSGCEYRNPCIIGTLMTPAERLTLDHANDDTSVWALANAGTISFPENQVDLANTLQMKFDAPLGYSDDAIRAEVARIREQLA